VRGQAERDALGLRPEEPLPHEIDRACGSDRFGRLSSRDDLRVVDEARGRSFYRGRFIPPDSESTSRRPVRQQLDESRAVRRPLARATSRYGRKLSRIGIRVLPPRQSVSAERVLM